GEAARRLPQDEGKRYQPSHGVAEHDHRQAGMPGGDLVMDGSDVREHLGCRVAMPETARRSVRRRGSSMATMIVRIGVEAVAGEEFCKASVTLSMLCKPVVDLDHGLAGAFGDARIEPQRCSGA